MNVKIRSWNLNCWKERYTIWPNYAKQKSSEEMQYWINTGKKIINRERDNENRGRHCQILAVARITSDFI
jgi:hypothetical protein